MNARSLPYKSLHPFAGAAQRLSRPEKRGFFRRYGVAVLCMLVAFAIRYCLTPILGEELPFMLFIAASMVATWYGGAVPGITCLLLGLFLADHFFLVRGKPGMSRPDEILHILRYIFTASLGIFLIEIQNRGRLKLQAEVEMRARSEQDLKLAQAQLATHADQLEKRVAERSSDLAAQVAFLKSFLYEIAHNLRAPLRAARGFADILANEYGSKLDSTAQHHISHISDAMTRMDDLIKDLLDYGRLGHLKPRLTTVKLGEVVNQTLDLLAYEIHLKNADVCVVQPLPNIVGDQEVLKQVLTNIIENALKFTAPGTMPAVRIRSENRDSTARIWVEDNGIGIDPQHHERIFGIFETLRHSPAHTGTGIGLAIVKQGVQLMNGHVGVESNPGAGSRFWIELPLAPGVHAYDFLSRVRAR
jgi:signal transduction histidine kinase